MSIGQLDSQERVEEAVNEDWQHAARAAQVPQRASKQSTPLQAARDLAGVGLPRTSWWKAGLRMLRNACIGVALISAVPFAVIAVRGDVIWFEVGDLQHRIESAEAMRGYSAPVNPDVTVAQAGAAMHSLQAIPTSAEFPTLPQVTSLDWTWGATAPSDPSAAPGARVALPETNDLIARANAGLGEDELARLRGIAESPVWSAVELVATAAQVDFIGSQFVLPFKENAWAPAMPIQRFGITREVAKAGIARAAYYVAVNDYDRAEQALRTVVSYGFSFIDNGTNALDGIIGRVIVGIGADGFKQLAVLRGDDATVKAVSTKSASRAVPATRRSAAEIREQLLSDATDPSVPRTLRYESLSRLAFASCGDARGVLTGTPADVRAAFDNARSTLAHLPAEQAYLDMLYRTPDVMPEGALSVRGLSKRMLLGAATVASTALQNPRILSCTRVVMAHERLDR